ncbi:unnamed protein product [Psylliodes chrysocephalus]|uniref:Uncharacterized protein n=1 Tax=Psylliodes chrysocephalus TaxID=3402493 RepID=A0A9P0G7M4_9CUCU|nr:unnamed protein product [Psylliodes chrysocephala]
MKNVKFLKDGTIICCSEKKSEEEDTDSIPQNVQEIQGGIPNVDKITITYLEELIKQKDMTIKNQDIAIKALSDQINLLKQLENQAPKSVSVSPSISSLNAWDTSKADQTEQHRKKTNVISKPVTKKALSNAVHTAESLQVCQEVINLNKEESYASKTSVNKPNKARNLLIGNNENLADCPFKAAVTHRNTLRHYHATNLEPDTDQTELLNYMKKYAPNIEIQKLNSRSPQLYSSFKITVPSEESDNILKMRNDLEQPSTYLPIIMY